MVKLRIRFIALILVTCLVLIVGVALSQPLSSPASATTTEVRTMEAQSQQELARAVLVEAGIAKRYDMYLYNAVESLVSSSASTNTRFVNWLHGLFVREAGWNYAEDDYITQMTDLLSAAELQELLTLVKRPIVKKLIQAEVEGYAKAAGERRKLLLKVWDRYNSGEFPVPPGLIR